MTGLLVHEWIEEYGGSERVFDAITDAFSAADIFVLWDDTNSRYRGRTVAESFLAHTPLRRHKALALPFMPAVWRNMPNNDYDWMLISSHLFAHHARVKKSGADIPKFVYTHTPARYIWSPDLDPRGAPRAVKLAAKTLKPLDRRRAREPVAIAANSSFVRNRIREAWRRDSTVIYPPVDVNTIMSHSWKNELTNNERELIARLPETFLLGASRFIPYKQLELVIDAAQANKIPAVLAGHGPHEHVLRERGRAASIPVQFIMAPSDAMLRALYVHATVFIFPAIEDFGIMPIEAMASGTPVVVRKIGGAGEVVRMHGGGAIVNDLTPPGWRSAVNAARELATANMTSTAERFSINRFQDELTTWMACFGVKNAEGSSR